MLSLQEKGYIILSMPAEDVQPLGLLEKTAKGVAQNLNAHIKDLFEPAGYPLPAVKKNIQLPAEQRSVENLDLKTEVNFNFLKALTRFFTGTISASAALEKKNNVQLKMNDLRKDTVNILNLDAYIQHAQLNTSAASFRETIEKGNLFVITETIKSSSFSLGDEQTSQVAAGADVPVQQVAEAKGALNYSRSKDHLVEHKGSSDLTIGIKAYQIFYRSGKFTIKNADTIKVVRGDQFPAEKLTGEEGFITLKT